MGALDPQTQKEAQRLIDAIYPLVAQRFYETGEWVPRLVGSSTAGVLTYSPTLTTGSFIRIGAKVTAVARITLTAVTTPAAGDLRLTGLPYAVGASGFRWGSVTAYDDFNLTAGSLELKVYPVAGQSYAQFAETVDNGDRVTAVAGNLTATTTLDVVLEYEGADRQSVREAILALGPIAYWPLDETSGTTATDISGNGRNGTYVNSPTLGGSFPPFVAPTFTSAGAAYVNIYSAGLAGAFNGDEGSIIGLWRPAITTGTQNLIRIATGSQEFVRVGRFESAVIGSRGDTIGSTLNPSGGAMTLADWNLVGISYSLALDYLDVYLNGQQVATTTGLATAWTLPISNLASVISGSFTSTATARIDGQAAHVALFAAPLSGSDHASIAGAFQGEL